MSTPLRQWDIVKVRINPEDRDEHPAVVISPDEVCADEKRLRLNVLYGTTRRPGIPAGLHESVLNGADGLDAATLFSCAIFYLVDRRKISRVIGRVAPARRGPIGRKIVQTFRLLVS